MDGSTELSGPGHPVQGGVLGTVAGVIGVGTDLVEVERIRAALGRRDGLRQRLFTDGEWDYAARHRDPMPHLAARFAAKESVMKALGHGMDQMAFSEIEVLRDDAGRPTVRLAGRAARIAADAGVADPGPTTFGGIALAHNVRSRAEVDEVIRTAEAAGATITRAPAETFYGGYAGCFAAPDGHQWEITFIDESKVPTDDEGNA